MKKKKRNGIKETKVRGTFYNICANSEKLHAALLSLSWEHVQWATRNFHHSVYGYVCVCIQCLSQVQLCDRMDCSPPGSSVHGILQARILEWVARPVSRGSVQPRE